MIDHPAGRLNPPPPPPEAPTARLWIAPLVGLLLALHVALGFSAAIDQCTTCDEIAHLTAGYAKWKTGDFRLVPEHPPLAQLWAALPLLVMDVKFPTLDQPSWWTSHQWNFGAAWFYETGNDPQRLLAAGRFMMALLSAALGLTVFLWSRRLFGTAGGLISLALYTFSPTLLANGALITTDLAAGLFFLLATGAVWMALHRVSIRTVAMSGLALGGLFLAKMSAPLIAPIYAILLAARMIRPAPLPVELGRGWLVRPRVRRLAIHAGVAVAQLAILIGCIWIGHGMRYSAMKEAVAWRDHLPVPEGTLPAGVESWDHVLQRAGPMGDVVDAARRLRVLPEAYLYGFIFAIDMTRGSDAFLNGQRAVGGFTQFFPYTFLVKSTLPFLVLPIFSLVAGAYLAPRRQAPAGDGVDRRETGPPLIYELTPLLALLLVYWLSAVMSSFNIGHRHLLPTYPPLFILAGSLAAVPLWRSRAWRGGVIALLGLHAAASTSVWPNYLAYFNVIGGGPAEGFRHLVDSSLDWGQGLPGLKRWLDANARGERVYLSYMGNGSPSYYGISAENLPTFPPKPLNSLLEPLTAGVYCISATNLQLVRILPASAWTEELERLYQLGIARVRELNHASDPGAGPPVTSRVPDEVLVRLRFARLCAYLRLRRPDAVIGHSIFVYRLSQGDIDAALFGPPPEAAHDDPESLYRMGDMFAEMGAARLAELFYQLALRLRPDEARVRHNLGVVLGQMGRIQESLTELREAVRLQPDFADAYENLGNALSVSGDLVAAAPAYERAIALNPRKPEPYASLADVYALRDDLNRAAAMYQKVLTLRPNWPEARSSLASVYARQGRMDLAAGEYREALRLRPNWAAVQNDLGTILAEQKQLDAAIEAFDAAVRLQPSVAVFHFNLANALLRRLRCAEAIPQFNEALRLEPNMEDARKGLEKALEIMQNPSATSEGADVP